MENTNIIDQEQDQQNETKDTIVNSEDQQKPVNVPDDGEPGQDLTSQENQKENDAEKSDNWKKDDPSEDPQKNPGNATDDSDEIMHKIPNA